MISDYGDVNCRFYLPLPFPLPPLLPFPFPLVCPLSSLPFPLPYPNIFRAHPQSSYRVCEALRTPPAGPRAEPFQSVRVEPGWQWYLVQSELKISVLSEFISNSCPLWHLILLQRLHHIGLYYRECIFCMRWYVRKQAYQNKNLDSWNSVFFCEWTGNTWQMYCILLQAAG